MQQEIAFQSFKEIESLKDLQKQRRLWLKDYVGLKYGFGEEGHHKKGFEWTKTKYKEQFWSAEINLIGERKDRLKIEFDGNSEQAKKDLELTEKKIAENGWGYIRSTHNGKSDYLWVEFDCDITDKEKEAFLEWIAPEDSEIDFNFASSKKIFPILFAVHWKHSYEIEKPIRFVAGKKIDYKSLNLKTSKKRKVTIVNKDGFEYETYKKKTVFTRGEQAKIFSKEQPIFYDKSAMFWIWNTKKKYWEIADDVDVLNMIEEQTGKDIISSKNRTEILNALKQQGRKNIPKPIKSGWIQFRNLIYDLKDGSSFEATPDYFVTNPIDWTVSGDPTTPNMDKIFEQWVGKEYVKTLHQIIAYSLLPSYPIHRLFCFIGSGLNGKSCFLKLLKKFVGQKNTSSTELDRLMNSRFEVTRLHKKLICLMGETNFTEMKQTALIKTLTGEDEIPFEYKNKTPFGDVNYAKLIIATNNLPSTTDKTVGWYRRWLILDFPNDFTEKVDILDQIPEEEYNNLATNSLIMLKELLDDREFHNEGNIENRMKRYEDRSNPIEKFIEEFCIEDLNGDLTKKKFSEKLNDWCKANKHRSISDIAINKRLKELGYHSEKKYVDWLYDGKGGQIRIWKGLVWKDD